MSFTAFGELMTELGDIVEAVIHGLSEHALIDRTTSTTTTTPGGKRKPEVSVTVTKRTTFTMFHLLFIMVVTGVWTPVRDMAGNLKISWADILEGARDLGLDIPEEGEEKEATIFGKTLDEWRWWEEEIARMEKAPGQGGQPIPPGEFGSFETADDFLSQLEEVAEEIRRRQAEIQDAREKALEELEREGAG